MANAEFETIRLRRLSRDRALTNNRRIWFGPIFGLSRRQSAAATA